MSMAVMVLLKMMLLVQATIILYHSFAKFELLDI